MKVRVSSSYFDQRVATPIVTQTLVYVELQPGALKLIAQWVRIPGSKGYPQHSVSEQHTS